MSAGAARYGPELAAVSAHPSLFAQLEAHPGPAVVARAERTFGASTYAKIAAAEAAPGDAALYGKGADGKPLNLFRYTLTHASKVERAAEQSPGQWRTWYWICFGCMVFFLLTVPIVRGRWSPGRARQDEAAHEKMVNEELARLRLTRGS